MIDDLDQFNRGLRLNIASVSDVHLGHPTTPTDFIIRNLHRYVFPDDKDTRDLDLIFIDGDFFDSLQDPASNNSIAIRQYVVSLLYFCKKHDIPLRILRGTKLHDWDQPYIFKEENDNHSIGCDLLYVDRIHIEYIERYGIHVLYVPDEANSTAAQTWEEVQELMKNLGITKVDYASMHGGFPHQLPEIESIKHILHNAEDYLSIVRHYIFIGHIHQHSVYDRIIANGSTDRLVHGDEGAKGHVRVKQGRVKFIENIGAMRYKTLDVEDLSADMVIEHVIDYLNNDETRGNIRLRCSKQSVAYGMEKRLSKMFPFIRFSYLNTQKKQKTKEVLQTTTKIQLPILTRENLEAEVLKGLKEEHPETYELAAKLLSGILHGGK